MEFLTQVMKTEGEDICREVRDLEIKEMPLEEKYDRLLDDFLCARAKFWLFFLLGICIYMPFLLFSIMIQFPLAAISFLGFSSSKFNVFLCSSYPFKDFFLNK